MPFWRRPFELSIPDNVENVLAAARAVDPFDAHGESMWRGAPSALWITVDGSRIDAYLWSPRANQNYGPRVRALAAPHGVWTTIVGELSWARLTFAFALMPVILGALIGGGFWAQAERPDVTDGDKIFFYAAGALALLIVVSACRLPRRLKREEQALRDALLRDLNRPGVT